MSSIKTSHKIEYRFIRLFESLASTPPRPLALAFGGLAGILLHHLKIYHRIVRKNLEFTGYWTPDEINRLLPRLYRNIGRYATDFLRNSKKKPTHDFDGMPVIDRMRASGKGTIVVLSHLGGWETLAAMFGKQVAMNAVVMPMSNPAVEKWVLAKRTATGVTTIYQHNALRRILSALKKNEVVVILIDQNHGSQGTPVNFLGKETSTIRTVAGLLHRTGCSIFLCAGVLKKDNSYHILYQEGRDLGISRDDEEAFIRAYQKEHNDVLSQWIREYPEHYFGWFHRRFKDILHY